MEKGRHRKSRFFVQGYIVTQLRGQISEFPPLECSFLAPTASCHLGDCPVHQTTHREVTHGVGTLSLVPSPNVGFQN